MTDIIREYYNKNSKNEWLRLNDPYNRLELFSTMYMIKEYFPQEGKILDIGSGPGRYSIELLKRGYEVSLMDLSEKSIDMAKNNIESMGLKAKDYICGDALYLDFIKDNTFDGILLMGPMYHVKSREDRIRILENCMRILKPGGIILIAYINSLGVLKVGLSDFPQEYKDINKIYDLFDEKGFSEEESFTETYFTVPEKAISEVNEVGFNILSRAGAESFLSGQAFYMTKYYLEDKEIYFNLLKVATEKCEDERFRDSTEHLIIVAKK
ncbi:class I SAM-dependent methyltransferase [Clostridium perfringens]|uniref:class I SAM-dependent methyltransferase n=1 Tax=Clostridium perfringens TaxID=1502 RepID=UPI000D713581|nr:class I SAM-dependent methyltransferase [Clostridium perfringens]MBO3320727.1 methyltransferase domain-containing protein [Clostridium perfringens]MCX0417671.1 methyltransferase domain-containing protein [Clostridium perfringens]MDU4605623.1 class I SAM-dependent methyltransferase [Clostridium perfringens]MDU4830657.1 class I SAM-dependent methyltransferase [Clostridium perfringens]NGT12770.1 class I SAM-dependent methyltransferase [Clostridium perfringens]